MVAATGSPKPLQLRSLVRLLLDSAREQDEATRAGEEESNAALPVGTRVLLAEDSPVNQQVASGMLVAFGCQVRVVENGQLALEVLEEEPYDLVLMDCMMPVLDGFEATAEWRRRSTPGAGRSRPAAGLHRGSDRQRDDRRPRALPESRHGRLRRQAIQW